MATLVFDIETVGQNFDDFDEITQKTLLGALSEEQASGSMEERVAAATEKLGLSALTGQVVSIAILNVDTNEGVIYFQAPGEQIDEKDAQGTRYVSLSETEILKRFWAIARNDHKEFVTYNGRCFDVPFLMIRSGVLKIRPSVNLLANRYVNSQGPAKHIDLFDQLTFYGALYSKGMKLHMCCQAFGIPSPKNNGDGAEVQKLFTDKRYMDIAKYNMADVVATAELYKMWDTYLRF